MIIDKSRFLGNTAGWSGGGVFIWDWGLLTINDTTFSDNSAGVVGGAIAATTSAPAPFPGISVTLNNSTISGNSARQGGGIYNTGMLRISHSTTAGNSAYLGSGLFNQGTVRVKNSIISNPSGRNCVNYVEITSQGYNLSSDHTCNLTHPADLPNTDPLLNPLQDNGGPTQTHALLPDSPAIDAIPLANCTDTDGNLVTTDQRGVIRPQRAQCDIGAFEREGFTLTVTKNGTGSGTVISDLEGINCGTDCEQGYDLDTIVNLTATPDPGSVFAGWSGDLDCTDGQVTMNANKTCIATFNLAPVCQGVTATSSPARIAFSRANQQATIRVTVRNNSGAGRTVTAITPQADEPFTIRQDQPIPTKDDQQSLLSNLHGDRPRASSRAVPHNSYATVF